MSYSSGAVRRSGIGPGSATGPTNRRPVIRRGEQHDNSQWRNINKLTVRFGIYVHHAKVTESQVDFEIWHFVLSGWEEEDCEWLSLRPLVQINRGASAVTAKVVQGKLLVKTLSCNSFTSLWYTIKQKITSIYLHSVLHLHTICLLVEINCKE